MSPCMFWRLCAFGARRWASRDGENTIHGGFIELEHDVECNTTVRVNFDILSDCCGQAIS